MTRIVGDLLVIEKENPQQCDLCGEISELRPYGPNGECICFDCGQKDPETTEKMFYKYAKGVTRAFDAETGETLVMHNPIGEGRNNELEC